MKRLIVLTILVTTAISTTGCRRWGLRGARCGAPAPTYTPVPVPVYTPTPAPACPPVTCPPVTCPTACEVCPTPYSGGYGGYGGVMDGAVINGGTFSAPGTVMGGSGAAFQAPSIEGLPSPSFDRSTFSLPRRLPGGHPGVDLTKQAVPNKPVFSHVIGDRKLEPGETINREYELPIESAASAATSEKK